MTQIFLAALSVTVNYYDKNKCHRKVFTISLMIMSIVAWQTINICMFTRYVNISCFRYLESLAYVVEVVVVLFP